MDFDMTSHFHVSIGWSLTRPCENMLAELKSITNDPLFPFRFSIDSLKVKIGNAVTAIALPSKVEAVNSIIDI